MKRILKTIMYILIAIIILIIGFIYFLGKSDQVGTLASGERLKRMESSKTFKASVFENIENTPSLKEGVSQTTVLKTFFFGKEKNNVPKNPLPVIQTDLKNLDPNKDLIVWFGHSSYYIQIEGKRILVDPVFSKYASPVPVGIKAFPMTYEYQTADLPPIDLLIITHDHWDHLDYPTFQKIKNNTKAVVTSLGVGSHLEKWGYPAKQIHELYWGEDVILEGIQFRATPARHFSGRWFKRNTSLWSSFVLSSSNHKLFLGGDSGYGKHFKEIGEQYGPFDLAILENGQYNELWKYIHLMPEEAIQAAEDLKASKVMPVHNSKFPLANHNWDEPLIRISQEAKRKNSTLWTPQIGQITYLNKPNQFKEWWKDIN